MTLVAVGLPSYNEADSIGKIVAQVDQGLAETYGPERCLIVNVDSDSTDDTPSYFLGMPTRCPKESVVLRERPRGKGRNILHFLRLCEERGVGAAAMIDADIVTVTPDWVPALLGPITRGEVDFVVPRYRRSRFEGSTTNHFAYPLIYGWYNRDLRQPIGGDFGFSQPLIAHVLRQPVSPAVLGYGIDIHLTSHAVGGDWRIGQAALTLKHHKPGYHKFADAFPYVAQAAIDAFQVYSLRHDTGVEAQQTGSIASGVPFLHRAEGHELRRRMQRHLPELQPAYTAWLDGEDNVVDQMLSDGVLRAAGWTRLLTAAVQQAANSDSLSVPDIAQLLQPAFILRSVTFWEDSVDWSAETADEHILQQARIVRTLLKNDKPRPVVDSSLGRRIAQKIRIQQAPTTT